MKTKKDLLIETTRLILPPPAMKQFERAMVPLLEMQCPTLRETVPDEEYRAEVQKIKDNLPAISEYLKNHDISELFGSNPSRN